MACAGCSSDATTKAVRHCACSPHRLPQPGGVTSTMALGDPPTKRRHGGSASSSAASWHSSLLSHCPAFFSDRSHPAPVRRAAHGWHTGSTWAASARHVSGAGWRNFQTETRSRRARREHSFRRCIRASTCLQASAPASLEEVQTIGLLGQGGKLDGERVHQEVNDAHIALVNHRSETTPAQILGSQPNLGQARPTSASACFARSRATSGPGLTEFGPNSTGSAPHGANLNRFRPNCQVFQRLNLVGAISIRFRKNSSISSDPVCHCGPPKATLGHLPCVGQMAFGIHLLGNAS